MVFVLPNPGEDPTRYHEVLERIGGFGPWDLWKTSKPGQFGILLAVEADSLQDATDQIVDRVMRSIPGARWLPSE